MANPMRHIASVLFLLTLFGLVAIAISTAPAPTVVTSGAVAAPFAQAQKQNILVILSDDLGVDSVGIYNEGTNPPQDAPPGFAGQGGRVV